MPNWCMNSITFFSRNEEGENQLAKLNAKLKQATKKDEWLSSALSVHELVSDDYDCRGSITYIEEYIDGNSSFAISTETAWGPTPAMWETILEQYPDVNQVYVAEEPGNDIYINTDTEGDYYDYEYKADIYYDGIPDDSAIHKLGYGHGFACRFHDICEYLHDNEIVGFYEQIAMRKFADMEHLENFFTALGHISLYHYYLGLHKFNA